MITTPEMTLLNYCEVFGHKETARILREIVAAQNRDANADCEKQGQEKPLVSRGECREVEPVHTFTASELIEKSARAWAAHIRKLQDNALLRAQSNASQYYESLAAKAMRSFPKHKFIYLDGALRQDLACL